MERNKQPLSNSSGECKGCIFGSYPKGNSSILLPETILLAVANTNKNPVLWERTLNAQNEERFK